MKRVLAVAILPAMAGLLTLGSVVGIILRAGDDDDKPVRRSAGPAGTGPTTTQVPVPLNDACSALPADRVAQALGMPAGRLRGVPQRVSPEQGPRCHYQDSVSNTYIFFLHVQEVDDRERIREELEALTGNSIEGLGQVAKYEQLENGDSTIDALSGNRKVFLGTRGIRVPQDAMVSLARHVV